MDVDGGGPGPTPDVLWAQPNPLQDGATIRFRLNRAGPVSLGLYDASGRRLAELASGDRAAGFHEVRWDAAGVPAGIYFARLEWGGRVALRKLVRMN